MAIPTSNITEDYASLRILRKSHLSTAMDYIDTQFNTYTKPNLEQFALDVFGASYTFDNDGAANRATALIDAVGILDADQEFSGANTFSGAVTFSSTVSSSSTFTSSGQMRSRPYLTTANQSIPDSTDTALSFGAETYDVGGMHDNSTNPSRITIPTGGAGLYLFHSQVDFAVSATGIRKVMLFKNGTKIAETKELGASASVTSSVQVSAHDTASVNDYYEIKVYQSSGGALDVTFGERVTFFSAMKVW